MPRASAARDRKDAVACAVEDHGQCRQLISSASSMSPAETLPQAKSRDRTAPRLLPRRQARALALEAAQQMHRDHGDGQARGDEGRLSHPFGGLRENNICGRQRRLMLTIGQEERKAPTLGLQGCDGTSIFDLDNSKGRAEQVASEAWS